MELKINGKNCELNFGVRFVRELDKVAGVSSKGISLGMALTRTLPALETYDPVALSNVIYAGAYANSPRPTLDDADKFVETDEELEKHFDEILKEVHNSTATKLVAKNLKA